MQLLQIRRFVNSDESAEEKVSGAGCVWQVPAALGRSLVGPWRELDSGGAGLRPPHVRYLWRLQANPAVKVLTANCEVFFFFL